MNKDVLELLFGHLNFEHLVYPCAQVCRVWRNVCLSKSFWKRLAQAQNIDLSSVDECLWMEYVLKLRMARASSLDIFCKKCSVSFTEGVRFVLVFEIPSHKQACMAFGTSLVECFAKKPASKIIDWIRRPWPLGQSFGGIYCKDLSMFINFEVYSEKGADFEDYPDAFYDNIEVFPFLMSKNEFLCGCCRKGPPFGFSGGDYKTFEKKYGKEYFDQVEEEGMYCVCGAYLGHAESGDWGNGCVFKREYVRITLGSMNHLKSLVEAEFDVDYTQEAKEQHETEREKKGGNLVVSCLTNAYIPRVRKNKISE